jgi:hypothetical protein
LDHRLLHKIRGRETALRTSLYADDAAAFFAPFKEGIQNLSNILALFGNATGLETNFQKSMVAPICYQEVDIDDVFLDMPAVRASFPMKYLGLPLSIRKLKRVVFQPLEDNMGNKTIHLGWQEHQHCRTGNPHQICPYLASHLSPHTAHYSSGVHN